MVIEPATHSTAPILPPHGTVIEFNYTSLTGYRKQTVERVVGVIIRTTPFGTLLIRHLNDPAMTTCFQPHPGFDVRPVTDSTGRWITIEDAR